MWNLTFISEEDFTNHVKATIEKYGEKLESFDLKRFNTGAVIIVIRWFMGYRMIDKRLCGERNPYRQALSCG